MSNYGTTASHKSERKAIQNASKLSLKVTTNFCGTPFHITKSFGDFFINNTHHDCEKNIRFDCIDLNYLVLSRDGASVKSALYVSTVEVNSIN